MKNTPIIDGLFDKVIPILDNAKGTKVFYLIFPITSINNSFLSVTM